MKLFVWRSIDELTGHYHSGGGMIVAAMDWAAARVLIESEIGKRRTEKLPPADHEFTISGTLPFVIIFPDAGCC